jgi:hypothetical protein
LNYLSLQNAKKRALFDKGTVIALSQYLPLPAMSFGDRVLKSIAEAKALVPTCRFGSYDFRNLLAINRRLMEGTKF